MTASSRAPNALTRRRPTLLTKPRPVQTQCRHTLQVWDAAHCSQCAAIAPSPTTPPPELSADITAEALADAMTVARKRYRGKQTPPPDVVVARALVARARIFEREIYAAAANMLDERSAS